MSVLILSGIPGSGKSTLARSGALGLRADSATVICSADDSHVIDVGGSLEYRFDPARIQEAHDACLSKFLDWLTIPDTNIVVDNTNLHAWEIAPYYRMAELYRHEVGIVRVWCDPIAAAKRNVHGVPPDKVLEMYKAFLAQSFPPRWKVRTVWPGGLLGKSGE